jgi:hypothetical protein
MKITKTQLQEIIKEEIQNEYATMGVSSGKHRVQRQASNKTPLEKSGQGKYFAAVSAFKKFMEENPDADRDKLGNELVNNPPGGSLEGYEERVTQMLTNLEGR